MRIRELKLKDAEGMLEWMHDDSVVHDLYTNFSEKTMKDCKAFIASSMNSVSDINLAVVNENDEYMGTVSLKHIDFENELAEFAITVRKCAMGQGYSIFAMREILKIAKEKGIKNLYWCVSEKNARAVRFYLKHDFKRCEDVPRQLLSEYSEDVRAELLWFCEEM